jgi:peptide deformylase
MAIRDIIRMGHPTLRTPAKPYPIEDIGSPRFNQLIEDLTDTLADSGGIGLAAPQINEPVQVVIVNIPGGQNRYGELEAVPWSVYINPVLTVLDDSRAGYWEGCLSVPGLRGFVVRPQKIAIDFYNGDGEARSITAEGFTATVYQHEFDHLSARLYVDHIKDPRLLVFEDQMIAHDLGALTKELQEEVTRGIR